MKVQILLEDAVVATQIVSIEGLSPKPSLSEVKRIALKAALKDKTIRISESLRATFRVFDVNGMPSKKSRGKCGRRMERDREDRDIQREWRQRPVWAQLCATGISARRAARAATARAQPQLGRPSMSQGCRPT